jgi:hypothetical protein
MARAWLLLLALLLAGCTGNSLGLTGAGSMRIEVEVYKGPLSSNIPIQIGELRTVVAETARTLAFWYGNSGAPKGCVNPGCLDVQECWTPDCIALREVQRLALEMLYEICTLHQYVKSVKETNYGPQYVSYRVANECDDGNEPGFVAKPTDFGYFSDFAPPLALRELQPHVAEIAQRLSQLAGDMKSKGFRAADHLITHVPRDKNIRSVIVNFELIMAEYSNQIQARVGVLEKQLGSIDAEGRTDLRKRLPVGDYLRDASPTDFIRLFEWFDAGDSKSNTPGQLNVQERVRMAERLFADYYWEKVNEVYTSGQGDVSMAFIKNDIGNWDLKSFSNDPAELVGAYRSAADAAISAIAGVVSGGTTEAVSKGDRLFDLGNRIATGETSIAPNLGVLDAAALHKRTLAKLSTLRASFTKEEANKLAAKSTADKAVTTAESEVAAAATEVMDRQTRFDNAERLAKDCALQHPTDAATQCASVIAGQETAREAKTKAEAAKAAADASLDAAKLQSETAAADVTALRKAAQEEVRGVLDDHLALIAMLQEAVAGSAEAAADAEVPPVKPGADAEVPPVGPAADAKLPGETALLGAAPPLPGLAGIR